MTSIGISLQYACFACKKSFRRPRFTVTTTLLVSSEPASPAPQEALRFESSHRHKCPDCGRNAYSMGSNFRAPKRADTKAWQAAEQRLQTRKSHYGGSQD